MAKDNPKPMTSPCPPTWTPPYVDGDATRGGVVPDQNRESINAPRPRPQGDKD